MRRIVPVIAICGLALAACASTRPAAASRMQWSESISGWVTFRGEFLLFGMPDALPSNDLTRCTSGNLPTGLHARAAETLEGKRVIVTGRMVVWTAGTDDRPTRERAAPIRKVCDGPLVFLADSIREAP